MNFVIVTRKYLWIWSEFSLSVRKDDNKKSTVARKDCRLTTSPPHELFKPRSGRESDRDEGIFECLAGPKQNAKTKRHAIHVMFIVSVQFWLVDNFPKKIFSQCRSWPASSAGKERATKAGFASAKFWLVDNLPRNLFSQWRSVVKLVAVKGGKSGRR